MHIGVDIGGTFTDLVMSDRGGIHIHKLLSTPANPSHAMIDGLLAVALKFAGVERVAHGSTVATNAILERKGARCALITTQGFRDVLAIGRQNRPQLYALHPTLPAPLIARADCYEVRERLDHTGEVITPIDLTSLELSRGYDAVAVCLLYSYLNPMHERAVRDYLMARGYAESQIILSSDVLPEFREYERASTAALEAYVRPVMDRYLSALEAALPVPLRVMKSDGGVISAGQARRKAVLTALSGPAAGVIGAFHIAKLAGYDRIITLDMGGTSTDVALCPGEPIRRADSEIDGLPLRTRVIDIETVGAGGGSIARIDSGGVLQVGPESAGAMPGPIVYGRGGVHITVSDANAMLGRLDADHFLGGRMSLDFARAREVFTSFAAALDISVDAAALGVVALANANIERAVRRVSVSRGYDPADFTLVAFGGAGPLHACEVAATLRIPRVLIPHTPGVLCAFGLLVADVQIEHSQTVLAPYSTDLMPKLTEQIRGLMTQCKDQLTADGIPPDRQRFTALVDARYAGQAYELTIPFALDARLDEVFHTAHERAYGHSLKGRTVEIVNVRAAGIGDVEKPILHAESITPNDGSDAVIGVKSAQGEPLTLYKRDRLHPGARFRGAALVFQLDSTVYIPAGWRAYVDGYRNLVLESGAQS